ncbi:MAG TPA: DUF6134 family protein [Acetobacteraceae bacterium]|nr:DUF6134 family protein [Acetobacteraceae bacterium]
MEEDRRNALTRRGLLAGAAVLGGARFARAGLPVPPDSKLAFRLMRHGSPIGSHMMSFSRDGDALTVHIAVDVLVKFGPIPFVRYTHRNQEVWQHDRLVGFESRTDRNGTPMHVQARWQGSGLAVEGSGTRPYVAPANALATTHWNSNMLRSPMIGTQDGQLIHPAVAAQPEERIKLASGEQIPARHYRLSGDLDLDIWYDSTDTWAGLRFAADDGSVITYERLG